MFLKTFQFITKSGFYSPIFYFLWSEKIILVNPKRQRTEKKTGQLKT